jgi:hypothetical protein
MQDQSIESGIVPENNKRSYSVTSGRNGKQPVCRINAKGLAQSIVGGRFSHTCARLRIGKYEKISEIPNHPFTV